MINSITLPTINAILNAISAIFLFFGFAAIKMGNRDLHKKLMVIALISSASFLTCYLIYHYQVGAVPYPHYDWRRKVYFAILVPHVILAAIMTPFIIWGVLLAFLKKDEKHKKIMRWVWPVWMFVSVSGVVVYLMLYVF